MDFRKAKIAMMMGKGIEGCGVTRICSEMQSWCNKNNIKFTVFGYDEKKYARSKSHKLDYVSFQMDDMKDIENQLNDYDMVIYNSYPSSKHNHDAIRLFFTHLVKNVNAIKVGYIHEIHRAYIDKIPYLLKIMNEMDMLYGYGEKIWFSQMMAKAFPSKKIGERIKRFNLWFDFDEAKKFRNENLNDKKKKIMYIGRWTSTKEPHRLLYLSPLIHEQDKDFDFEMQGIEHSIGAKFDIFTNEYTIDRTGKEPKNLEHGLVNVYGEYNHDEAMNDMAHSMFGCSFFRIPKHHEDYGDRMEYTMIEMINCGAIPVFDIDWAKNNKMSTGEYYYDAKKFAIISDPENLQGTADEIIKVSKDESLRKEMMQNGYEIVKREFDADKVLPTMFQEILDTGKDEGKFKNDESMIKSFIDDEYINEFLDLYHQYNDKEIIVFGVREMIEHNIFSIIDGHKENEIKIFKHTRRLKKAEV